MTTIHSLNSLSAHGFRVRKLKFASIPAWKSIKQSRKLAKIFSQVGELIVNRKYNDKFWFALLATRSVNNHSGPPVSRQTLYRAMSNNRICRNTEYLLPETPSVVGFFKNEYLVILHITDLMIRFYDKLWDVQTYFIT